jgi:hypothetical protein
MTYFIAFLFVAYVAPVIFLKRADFRAPVSQGSELDPQSQGFDSRQTSFQTLSSPGM